MTTITAKITNKKDVKTIQEVLDRFGIQYIIDEDLDDFVFTEAELKSFEETQNNFKKGKTTARDWNDIQKDLNNAYD